MLNIEQNYGGLKMKVVLDCRTMGKNKEYPIKIRTYYERTYSYIPTGFYCTKRGFLRLENEVEDNITTQFEVAFECFKSKINDGIFDQKRIKNYLENAKNTQKADTLAGLISIKSKSKSLKISTRGIYESVEKIIYNVFSDGIPLNEVNSYTIGEIQRYLIENEYSVSTIQIYMSAIKSVINEAVWNKRLTEKQFPFKKSIYDTEGVQIPTKKIKRNENYLTIDEINKVFVDFKTNKNKYVGLFLLSYYMGGINLADLLLLKFDNHYKNTGELHYNRVKTEKKNDFYIRVPITEKIDYIMEALGIDKDNDYWLFPEIQQLDEKEIFYKKINLSQSIIYNMKKTSKKVGINKNITMNYARHSFCTNAKRLMIPYDGVEYLMGHSNSSISSHYTGEYTTKELKDFLSLL